MTTTAPEPQPTGVALGSRALFPTLQPRAYLNFAAISPTSMLVQEAVQAWLADYSAHGVGAYGRHAEQRDRLKGKLATLLGCAAEDLALGSCTSALISDVAFLLDWKAGDRVLVYEGEFPAITAAFQAAAPTFGFEVVMRPQEGFGDGSGDGLARLEAELKRGLRLVAVSSAQFQTGLHLPVAAMAGLCHRYGAQLLVDAAQSFGCVPLDVTAAGVDFLAAPSHKWLMGVEGGGVLYVRPEALERLVLRRAGWLSVQDGIGFLFEGEGHLRYDRPLRRKADVVEVGVRNGVGMVALEAGITPMLELGLHAVFAHVQRLHDRLEPALEALGLRSVRAQDPAARSGILSFRPPEGMSVAELMPGLGERGVSLSSPDGLLRASPSWPSSEAEIDATVAAVADVLGR